MSLSIIFVIVTVLVLPSLTSKSKPTHVPKVDSRLEIIVAHDEGATANIFIAMRKGTGEVLNQISTTAARGSFRTRYEKRAALYSALRRHADESQESVKSALLESCKEITPDLHLTNFWISNMIYIRNAPLACVLDLLSERDDVVSIDKEDYAQIQAHEGDTSHCSDNFSSAQETGYNLELMRVPELWALGVNGTGVVIGNIATGVRYTHEALRDTYKNDHHSWLDASEETSYAVPTDDSGLGTMLMGLSVGGGGVGVAFGAQWISCKACNGSGLAPESSILACMQFVVAPAEPNGSRSDVGQTVDVVAIGWSVQSRPSYDDVIAAWRVAGIIPVVASIGSPGCYSLSYPSFLDVIGVGATDDQDGLGEYSGIGPGPNGVLKPDLTAPGVRVRSTSHCGNSDYDLMSDRMSAAAAGAQVAGVVALLLSADPLLGYEDIKEVLEATADRNLKSVGASCGGVSDSEFPNFHFGYGRVDALAAYNCINDPDRTCLQNPKKSHDNTVLISLTSTGGVVLTLSAIFFTFIYLRRRYQKPLPTSGERQLNNVDGDTDGVEGSAEVQTFENIVHQFQSGVPHQMDVGQEAVIANYSALTRPYDFEKYEISTSRLEIDKSHVLGSGEFGVVCAGVLKQTPKTPKLTPNKFAVAVKKLKATRGSSCSTGAVHSFLKELQIMSFVGTHPNIVQLLGACTREITAQDMCMVLELCEEGNLEKYLRARRNVFVNMNDMTKANQSGEQAQAPGPVTYVTVSTPAHGTGSQILKPLSPITSVDLFRWTSQIVSGMEFLASKKVVHGDLATRNVLLDENLTVKISDFGLASKLYEYVYARMCAKEEQPLPWRWMAPETLRDLHFSTASDVWSFGITVWEIFSLAETPYPGQVWGETFLRQLEEGYRNLKPAHASSELFAIIVGCWAKEPSKRPSMTELKKLFCSAHANRLGITS